MIDIHSYQYRRHVLVVMPAAVLVHEAAVLAFDAPGALVYRATSLGDAQHWVDQRAPGIFPNPASE